MNGHIKNLEFNWLAINTVLAAVGVGIAVIESGRLLLTTTVHQALAFGSAIFMIGMITYPIASIYMRQRRGRDLRWIRHALGSVVGGCIAALLHVLLA